jgi:hypothetical protein
MRAFPAVFVLALACGSESPPPLGNAASSDASASDASSDASVSDVADAGPAPNAERVLFVGNSFTFVNDLPGTYGALVTSVASTPFVDSVAYGGYTLAQDLADVQGTGTNPRLGTLLGGGDAAPTTWNFVVLQEQSEIPGFPADNPERQASMAAVVSLSAYVAATGATSVMFMTWGFPTGDSANPSIFPDYVTMQSLLETGYRDMAHAVAMTGRHVVIAPAGLAFKAVYDRDVAGGRDPNATGSLFAQLYGPDAKHPAPPGTYVTACVMAATIDGIDPTKLTADVAGVDVATRAVLQTIARDVVATERARPPP